VFEIVKLTLEIEFWLKLFNAKLGKRSQLPTVTNITHKPL